MKNILTKFKDKLPTYKDKILESLDVLTIYQGILFIVAPTGINQLLLIGLIIIFILLTLKKI